MAEERVKDIVEDTFDSEFNYEKFKYFIRNLLGGIDESKNLSVENEQIKKESSDKIMSYKRIGQYTDSDKNVIDVLSICVADGISLDRNRTMFRNFVARDYMDGKIKKVNVLAAFYQKDRSDWRFSFIEKVRLNQIVDSSGKVKIEKELPSARRHSFLVGEGENNHTVKVKMKELLDKDGKVSLKDIKEAFNVEKVSKEFFVHYKECLKSLVDELGKIRKKDEKLNKEFEKFDKKLEEEAKKNNEEAKKFNNVFCEKLLSQLVFLYFIQKKGWLGVAKNGKWGDGNKHFLRETFERAVSENKNFFNEYLTPLFYNALAKKRNGDIFELLNCRIPFLNGGLFDPIENYDWKKLPVQFSNKLFSNDNLTKEKDKGDGILDIFDRYNFTVREDEPLEKEVAVDPEMLGKIFEKILDEKQRKNKGAFYTPREIVHYICQESLINYLSEKLENVSKEDVSNFIRNFDSFSDFPKSIEDNLEKVKTALVSVKVCDPAIGSGAFPVGILTEIVKARMSLVDSDKKEDPNLLYQYKLETIQNSIYGVDLDSGAVEIARLRLWLSLVVDEENFDKIKPLPNLDFKIMEGNSLLRLKKTDLVYQAIANLNLKNKKDKFFDESSDKKQELKEEINNLIREWTESDIFDFRAYFSEVFSENGGFDIVIGNPPYVSTKRVTKKEKELYKKHFGFSDDTYNMFTFKGLSILRNKGSLSFITPKTFWTTQTKKNMRDKLLLNTINYIFDTANPFESAMVDTCVFQVTKSPAEKDHQILFLDGTKDLINPEHLPLINQSVYVNAQNKVFFKPTEFNLRIYELYNDKVKSLYNTWWEKIRTSSDIEQNKRELDQYRKSLKPGDVTLLGCLTDGGVGLQTGNNGKYIAVRSSTKWAKNIKETRHKKLSEAIRDYKIKIPKLKEFPSEKEFLDSLSEGEIANLFDSLKEKYGRDIFGQGYIYRIIDDDELADVDSLTKDEKENGIDKNKKHYVPYDKGDKDGNRWYLETPYAISWTKENVHFLNTDPKARYQGYTFYFREGLKRTIFY